MPPLSPSTGVAITNPLVLYRSLVATKRIDPDPAQHRLAIHLQKVYERLKDYEPIVQYSHRLNQLSRALGSTPGQHDAPTTSPQNASSGVLSSLFERKAERDSLALTRVLTSHEAALEIDSPKGLMLHGEVGTGKSMLIDLFADCLPNRKKKRWHYNTFMLDIFAKLEQLRRSRQMIIPASMGRQDEYSLLWLARDMISTSPILFLDEFQLPDRSASAVIRNLMTCFFHLGGVLIATSNRMPEELAKAAGMDFSTPPPSRLEALGWRFGVGASRSKSETLFSNQGDFAKFLEVLKARCEVWEMENAHDYRRASGGSDQLTSPMGETLDGLEEMSPGNIGLGFEQSIATNNTGESGDKADLTTSLPQNFFVRTRPGATEEEIMAWAGKVRAAEQALFQTRGTSSSIPWQPGSLRVYGRDVFVPRQHDGVTSWTFLELCASRLGPADYISLASSCHTLILQDVPVLSILQKNEARRFITLLDALYEARCKLVITADAGPDDLFFPVKKATATSPKDGDSTETVDQDAVYSETLSEVYQDATAPFRPNISTYEANSTTSSEPDYTHARLAGIFNEQQLEDQPPNMPRRGDSIFGLDPSEPGQAAGQNTARSPNFSESGIFTGEDERFAYKRARSRLWEMCSAKWHARNEEGWWRPVDPAVRRWERPMQVEGEAAESLNTTVEDQVIIGMEGTGANREVDKSQHEVLFRHGASPFRTSTSPPPKFQFTHFWGMMKWGKKAGAWGQGVEGLPQRANEKAPEKPNQKID